MNKKFSLIYIGDFYEDIYSEYDGCIKIPMTAESFIEEILNNHDDEWGRIHLSSFDGVEYSHGEIVSMPENILDYKEKEIKSFTAVGGQSHMDYFLKFEEEF